MIFDGRNLYEPKTVANYGFAYYPDRAHPRRRLAATRAGSAGSPAIRRVAAKRANETGPRLLAKLGARALPMDYGPAKRGAADDHIRPPATDTWLRAKEAAAYPPFRKAVVGFSHCTRRASRAASTPARAWTENHNSLIHKE